MKIQSELYPGSDDLWWSKVSTESSHLNTLSQTKEINGTSGPSTVSSSQREIVSVSFRKSSLKTHRHMTKDLTEEGVKVRRKNKIKFFSLPQSNTKGPTRT